MRRRDFIAASAATLGLTLIGRISVVAGAVKHQPELLGVVEPAAAQPTDGGRTLQGLTWHENRLWGGYGDWRNNTGPIHPWSWSEQEGIRVYAALPTEAIERYVSAGGTLWTPATDPTGSGPGWVAFLDGNTWTVIELPDPVWHVFDLAEHLPTGEVWVSGADMASNQGALWRYNGVEFEAPVLVPVVDGRSYWLATRSDGALVTPSDRQRVHHVYNGEAWDLYVPEAMRAIFDYAEVYDLNGVHIMEGKYVGLPVRSLVDYKRVVSSAAGVSEGKLWLARGPRITPYGEKRPQARAIKNVRDLHTHDGYVYMGDNAGRLWRSPLFM